MVQAANKAGWWLRKADGSRSQWTTAYNHCDINISSWAERDSNGRTWQQVQGQLRLGHGSSACCHTSIASFSDNTFNMPRVDADWKRIGTNQPRTDSTIIYGTACRPGGVLERAAQPQLAVEDHRQHR